MRKHDEAIQEIIKQFLIVNDKFKDEAIHALRANDRIAMLRAQRRLGKGVDEVFEALTRVIRAYA